MKRSKTTLNLATLGSELVVGSGFGASLMKLMDDEMRALMESPEGQEILKSDDTAANKFMRLVEAKRRNEARR